MKDIFSELYKKVMSFFNNEIKEENSKDTACNRLKLVLMQDRAKMEPALMEKMREEMIEVISKYVEIDKDALDLNLEAEGESFALMLNIPVLRAKTREEIEAQEGIVIKDEDDDDDEVKSEVAPEAESAEDNPKVNDETSGETEPITIEEKEKSEDSTVDDETEICEEQNVKAPVVDKKDKVSENLTKQPPNRKKTKHQEDDDL